MIHEDKKKRKVLLFAFMLCTSWCIGLPGAATAQDAGPLPVEVALGIKGFSYQLRTTGPVFSPDGKMLAYAAQDPHRIPSVVTSEFRYKTGVGVSVIGYDIYVVSMPNGRITNLTRGKASNWAPSWSPDGRFLAFISDRDGDQAKLWLCEVASGSVRKVSDVPVRELEGLIQWMPDNQRVMVRVLRAGITPNQSAELAEHLRTQFVEGSKVPGATVRLYRSATREQGVRPEVSFVEERDLALVDVATGTSQRIDSGHRIAWFLPSPDSSAVAVVSYRQGELDGSDKALFDLKIISVLTGNERILLRNTHFGFDGKAISWSPDGSRIAYQVVSDEADGDFFVFDLSKEGPPLKIATFPKSLGVDRYVSVPLWDSEGKTIYFFREGFLWQAPVDFLGPIGISVGDNEIGELLQTNNPGTYGFWSPDGGKSAVVLTRSREFYRVDLSSRKTTKLLERDRPPECMCATVSQNGQVAYFASDAEHPSEIWTTPADFHRGTQLTHLNPEFEKYRTGATRLIDWLSLDGERLHGALLLPSGYEAGKRYPLIVYVYGGARLSKSLNSFGGNAVINLQLFATRGYAVLLPDAPMHVGTPMIDLVKTILPGVDKVIEMKIADPDRLGVMGHSYGGYSTLSLIVQTTRFKAAAMLSGYGDRIANYGAMTRDGATFAAFVEEHAGLMGGTPWQYRSRYLENSPIFYLDRVDTPLLITHGSEDLAVSSFLADEIFVDLRRLGKEVEYAKYEGGGHGPSRWSYSNYLDFCYRVIEWFDTRLKNIS